MRQTVKKRSEDSLFVQITSRRTLQIHLRLQIRRFCWRHTRKRMKRYRLSARHQFPHTIGTVPKALVQMRRACPSQFPEQSRQTQR